MHVRFALLSALLLFSSLLVTAHATDSSNALDLRRAACPALRDPSGGDDGEGRRAACMRARDGLSAQLEPSIPEGMRVELERSLPGDERWWDGFGTSDPPFGVNDWVCCAAIYHGDLILGGSFSMAGGVTSPLIVRWDGAQWHDMGHCLSDGTVRALAVYDDELIVGGSFHAFGEEGHRAIACWNGEEWRSFPANISGIVWALSVFEGDLVVGGDFNLRMAGYNAENLARWDGVKWHPLAQRASGTVYALGTFDDQLIVAGDFTSLDGTAVRRIARWDGAGWVQIGSGLGGEVSCLGIFDHGLVAGGRFTTDGAGAPLSHLARWNGSTWEPLGAGTDGHVSRLCLYEDELIAAGWFESAGGSSVAHIAAWDGLAWHALAEGLTRGTEYAAGLALIPYSGCLIAGGFFETAGDVHADNVAAWDGARWNCVGENAAPGAGMEEDTRVFAMCSFDGMLYAGGTFDVAGTTMSRAIAAWDGSAWHALGSGLSGSRYVHVDAMTVYDGRLVVGGSFGTAGGLPVSSIACWDGEQWSALGSGFTDEFWPGIVFPGQVYALAIYDGQLIAAGWFSHADGQPACCIARWDGEEWSELGGGIDLHLVPD